MNIRANIYYYLITILYLILAITVHDDFGATWDEFRNRKYAQEVVKTWGNTKYNEVLGEHGDIKDGDSHAATRGPLYLIILNKLESIFSANDPYHHFKFRRFFNHLFFITTGIIFLFFLKRVFLDTKVVTIAYLMYFLSPRIYAHSFYNVVDIPFLCFFLLFIISLDQLIQKRSIKTLLIHALICAIVTSLRTVGEISIIVSVLVLAKRIFDEKDIKLKDNVQNLTTFTLTTLIVYFFITPYLWISPWKSILEIHHQSANFGDTVTMPVLYLGNVFKSTFLPWHYTLIWICITLPSFYVIALFLSILKNLSQYKVWFTKQKYFQSLLLFIFIIVLLSACLFTYSKYNDWRHFYFLYPVMILIIAFTFDSLTNRRAKNIIFTFFLIQFSITAYDMYKYHPHQLTFFNRLSGGITKAQDKFPLEYFGSSYKQAIFEILEDSKNKNSINVSFYPYSPGWHNLQTLPENLRQKIMVVHDWKDADYFTSKWVFRPHNQKLLDMKQYIFKEISIDGIPIHQIYKLNHEVK